MTDPAQPPLKIETEFARMINLRTTKGEAFLALARLPKSAQGPSEISAYITRDQARELFNWLGVYLHTPE